MLRLLRAACLVAAAVCCAPTTAAAAVPPPLSNRPSATAPQQPPLALPPGCSLGSPRLAGPTLASFQLNASLVGPHVGLACCAVCSSLAPNASAFFVCRLPGGCAEPREKIVRLRPYGRCECQQQPQFERGLQQMSPATFDCIAGCYDAGVIARSDLPFVDGNLTSG